MGLHGVADLAPLPAEAVAWIAGTALVASLGVNDLVNRTLVARTRAAPSA